MGKTKASKVKKSNKQRTKFGKQGKLKYARNKKTIVKSTKPPVKHVEEEEEEVESDHGEDMLNMVDLEDLDFLKKAVVEGRYSMFKGAEFKKEKKLLKKQADEGNIEEEYERDMDDDLLNKREKLLLPIKSKGKVIKRTVLEDIKDEDEDEEEPLEKEGEDAEGEKVDGLQEDDIKIEKIERDFSKPVSVAEMMAWRAQLIAQYKLKIGVLASGVLEDPQHKVMNLKKLLDIYDEWHPELQLTLRKLVLVSLLEIFKDILPNYQIKHQDNPDVRLKKETKELQNFEKSLLKAYRGYLTRLEKVSSRLYRKKGDKRVWTKGEMSLGELAVKCLCELLVEHPHFNYSTNIVRLIIPYLDNKLPAVRSLVYNTSKQIFTQDKRGDVTLEIVRRINHLVKSRKHSVKPEVVSVLSYLKISEVNLEQLKEAEVKKKKLEDKKSRIINLSKKERKRQKRMAEVEKELLETKAEESKTTRTALLTEVTKLVFTVIFRILKSAPSSGLLSAALQSLAKFAHCINIEFYQDVVLVLDQLMSSGDLKVKEQLNCVLTVFKILSGQGESITIDPNKFYTHLYRNIFRVNAGLESQNSELLVECVDRVILGRRKKLTISRLLAFSKRIATASLYDHHHTTLALLSILKHALQNHKAVDILLDVDTSVGQGVYLPELDDPEYCNPENATLYDLLLLQSHYHPTVRLLATHLVNGAPPTGPHALSADFAKLSSKEVYTEFNPNEMVFKPPVPTPKFRSGISNIKSPAIRDAELSLLGSKALQSPDVVDFSELFIKAKKRKLNKEE